MTLRPLLALLLAGLSAAAQDVFVGGRVDFELRLGGDTAADFGRLAGLDVTFSKPGVLDAYVDVSAAGGDLYLQELYLSLPQTRRVAEVVLGRFLMPFGDSRTEIEDRYAVGARDLLDPYRAWRRGNVYLDGDLTGAWVRRADGDFAVDLAGGVTPGGDDWAVCARAELGDVLRGGASWFAGRESGGAALEQGAVHLGWQGRRATALGQLYLGRGAGDDQRGWLWRAGYRLPGAPVELHLAQTLFHDDAGGVITTTRLGATARFGGFYRAEARYEWLTAPAPFGDDRLILRLLAVF